MCRGILSTFEIADQASGRTDVIAQAVPPDPFQPNDPIHALARALYGFANTVVGDGLRLSLVNTALSPLAGTCPVKAGFVAGTGTILPGQQTANLGVGQSLLLDQPGGALLRPFVRFPLMGACKGILSTVEMVDATAGRTRFIVPPDPFVPPCFRPMPSRPPPPPARRGGMMS
jgi:hypothetical protein